MAARSVNKVTLIGNLGRDVETKFTPSGKARSALSVATERRFKDQSGEYKSETQWHRVIMWQNEQVAQELTKGRQVYIEGRLEHRSWDGADGKKQYITEIIAEHVIPLGGRHQESEDQLVSAPKKPVTTTPAADPLFISDDDVPF